MTADQLQLFTEREHRSLGAPPAPNAHGVYLEPDETLTLPSGRTGGRGQYAMPLAEIELLHVPAFGWIYSTAYHLGDCGQSGPLSLARAARGDSRHDALQRAVDELARRMDGYLRQHSDSATRKRQARAVREWAMGLLA